MPSQWSALKVELLETGANSGTWGSLTNTNLGDAVLGEAITGSATVDFSTDADVTITLTDVITTQAARNLRLNITESSTGIGSVRSLILGSGCQIENQPTCAEHPCLVWRGPSRANVAPVEPIQHLETAHELDHSNL